MTGQGRPFRFLAAMLLGWIAMRAVLLWPSAAALHDPVRVLAPLAGVPVAHADLPPGAELRRDKPVHSALPFRRGVAVAIASTVQPAVAAINPRAAAFAPARDAGYGSAARVEARPAVRAQNLPETFTPLVSRWSASAWLAIRPGTGIGAAPGASQLGGSQAGARLSWLALPRQRVALFARVTSPLAGKGREAAAGLEWQPFAAAPVRLVAEQRLGLDGIEGGPGVGVIAGIETRLPARFRLEAYGQGGVLHRSRTEPYVDAAMRATRSIAQAGRAQLSLGIGGWGAAQRDAARLDLGPSATLALPIGKANVRLAVDWRQRVAGDARPGSGLAVVLGSDF